MRSPVLAKTLESLIPRFSEAITRTNCPSEAKFVEKIDAILSEWC
jgi:hypothetical protein